MSDFNEAIPIVLRHEGGFVNNPADPGGATNHGISLRYLRTLLTAEPQLLTGLGLTSLNQVDVSFIQNLSTAQAQAIYYQDWWQKYQYGGISDQALANKVFDLAVNMGASRAAQLLQQACCTNAGYNCVNIDGMLGPHTFAYLNQLGASQTGQLITEFCTLAANYYRSLALEHPATAQFLSGWLNRVYDNDEIN